MEFPLPIQYLIDALKNPLPGLEVQLEMASPERRKYYPKIESIVNYKTAAVAICIYKKENIWHLPLIKRQEYEGVHSGQISFPGGKTDKNETFINTALREFHEETGFFPESAIHLGSLSPLYIPPSNFMVYPQVFYLNSNLNFNPNRREVQRIIEWPLNDFLTKTIAENFTVKPFQQKEFETPGIRIENDFIWGATAMMLNELKEVFKREAKLISFFQSQ